MGALEAGMITVLTFAVRAIRAVWLENSTKPRRGAFPDPQGGV